jgi:hypothetical protein
VNRGVCIGVVAQAYGQDAEMRKRLLTQLNPLPSGLRLRLVDRLASLGPEDDLVYKLLKDFDQDTGELVKTAGAIGLARSLRERADDERQLVCQLAETLRAVGPDHSERRQAAFAGLLELNRMDVATVRPASEKTSPPKWEFSGTHRMNLRLASHLAKHWDRIRIAFGATFWERVGYTDDEFLEEMLSHTSDEDLAEEILARLDKNKGDIVPSVAPLRVRSRQWRGTERLRRLCLDLVTGFAPSDWNNAAPGILAAEILGEQFAHDEEVRIEIEARADKAFNSSAVVVALCAAWPDSKLLLRIRDDPRQRLMTPAQVHLFCRFIPPADFINKAGAILTRLTGDIWDFLPTCTHAFEARFRLDCDTRELAFTRLEATAAPAEKCNLAQLLRRTDTQLDRLRAWARAELANQHGGRRLPDSALDIFTGRIRPIADVLQELILG